MTFETSDDSYERYMGRYSRRLALLLVDFAGIEPGMRVLDVGCGPGQLAAALAERLGGRNVAAADPSRPFAAACTELLPEADVRVAAAEALPWSDESFDAVLSQLVLNFMDDAGSGVGEMSRVVKPGGVVAACTWDYGEGMRMLRVFWDAALDLDPSAPDEARVLRNWSRAEQVALWKGGRLLDVRTETLEVAIEYEDFEDYWSPFLNGVGPGGAYCVSLDEEARGALRRRCFERLGSPAGSFTLSARAFAVRGQRPR